MAFELKEGQGTLHKNDKDGVAKRPDYRGDLMIDGTLYKLSAWLKDSKNGKWMSLSAQVKDDEDSRPAKASKPVAEDVGDDIPF